MHVPSIVLSVLAGAATVEYRHEQGAAQEHSVAPPSGEGPLDLRPVQSEVELENYRKYSIYPPNSRPVSQKRADAFKYNHRIPQLLPGPVYGPGQPRFYSVFTADKMWVFQEEKLTVVLKAVRTQVANAPALPISILDAGITRGRAQDAQKIASVAFHDDGINGDHQGSDLVYTATIDPRQLSTVHGSFRIYVLFSVDGATIGQQLFFDYIPDEWIAGRLTGRFRERIERGSLVIYAGIDVKRAGDFALDATMTTADGRAFCHSEFRGSLAPGLREIPFVFFGKAIRDGAGANPRRPFRIVELYGSMVPIRAEVLEMMKSKTEFTPLRVPLLDGTHKTKWYDMERFSDAEWASPEKDRQMKFFRQQALPHNKATAQP